MIVGFDPSLTAFGYTAVETEPRVNPVEVGIWETWPEKEFIGAAADNEERFAYLAQQIWVFVDRVKPERIFTEATVFIPGKMTAASIHALGRVRGFVDVVGAVLNVQVVELTPQQVKKGLGIIRPKDAEGMASKQEVRTAVERLYPDAVALIPGGKVGENGADAIAVAHVGLAKMAYLDRLSSGSSR